MGLMYYALGWVRELLESTKARSLRARITSECKATQSVHNLKLLLVAKDKR
jgi:hypothetical protein